MTARPDTANAPELPEAMLDLRFGYDAHQMRAYGQQCALAALSARSQSEWMPIETAPKDGSFVDAWAGHCREPDAFWGKPKFGNKPECWCRDVSDIHFGWVGEALDPQPSHWMRRPAPPKAGAETEGEA